MSRKRIFIGGGAGVIGSALVELLLASEAELLVGDLKPCPQKWWGKLKYRQGDLNSMTPQELISFDPEIVFHLAATFERSEESFSFFGENYHHNIKLSHHLLHCLKDVPSLSKVVFASSYLIYDPQLYQFSQSVEKVCTLTEETSVYPRNICGAAKFLHELELRFFDQFKSDITFISARIFRVYGRGSKDIISRWIRSALHHEKLTVYRPEGEFDYIFADDVAEGLVRLSTIQESCVVNLGSGKARSIHEVLSLLKGHFSDLKTEIVSSEIPIERSQASLLKLEKLIGWHPPHNLEKGIVKLIEYEKSQLNQPVHPEHQNVLITSISKKVPLIHSVKMAARKSGYFELVFGADSDHSCVGQYEVDQFWKAPPLAQQSIDDFISYCIAQNITAIIPTRDGELSYFAQHRQALGEKGIKVMVSSSEIIENCLDKFRFSEFLNTKGFPTIKTHLKIDQLSASRYVVKERRGAGSHKIGINLDQVQALQHSQQLQEPVFQSYIEGQEWSVDLYRSKEGKVKGVVARQRNLVIGGESQITTTVTYPALESLCQRMADALNLYGHAIFQVIEDKKGKFHVIECNPRFGGASTASVAVGLDSFFWFLMECLGCQDEQINFMRSKFEVKQVRMEADKVIVIG